MNSDLDSVKDEIRRLSHKRLELEAGKQRLESRFETAEGDVSKLKSEVLHLSSSIEVRDVMQVANASVTQEKTQNPAAPVAMDKYAIKDAKLELSIINAEIQKALKKLERQALVWEDHARQMASRLASLENKVASLPPRYMQSCGEIEKDITALAHQKVQIAASIGRERAALSSMARGMAARGGAGAGAGATAPSVHATRAEVLSTFNDVVVTHEEAGRLYRSVQSTGERMSYLMRELQTESGTRRVGGGIPVTAHTYPRAYAHSNTHSSAPLARFPALRFKKILQMLARTGLISPTVAVSPQMCAFFR